MVVGFPLREPTRHQLVDRRSPARRGRLRAPSCGSPRCCGVPTVRSPDRRSSSRALRAGSSLDPIGRTVRTDRNGRISVRLSRGPSGPFGSASPASRRYQPAARRDLALAVRGGARIEPSRAASAPAPGRLPGAGSAPTARRCRRASSSSCRSAAEGIRRYRTVGQRVPHRPRGRWRMRYRFDRFYSRRRASGSASGSRASGLALSDPGDARGREPLTVAAAPLRVPDRA